MANITTGLQVQRGTTGTIVPNGILIFNNIILDTSSSIDYSTDTGEITINDEGVYYIDWQVVTQNGLGNSEVSFGIKSTNDIEIIGSNASKIGIVSSSEFINVTTSDIQYKFTLINKGNGNNWCNRSGRWTARVWILCEKC